MRAVCRLRAPEGIEITKPSIYDILFEVQIRTAFEHAWAVAMHSLVYKAENVGWRYRRLAAQIKACVENLDSTILAFHSVADAIGDQRWPALESETKVSCFFGELFAEGVLVSEQRPKDLTRFCANFLEMLPRSRREAGLDGLLRELGERVRAYRPDQMPRSMSLLQFMIGLLHEMKVLRTEGAFCFHVTAEVMALFPATTSLKKFIYD